MVLQSCRNALCGAAIWHMAWHSHGMVPQIVAQHINGVATNYGMMIHGAVPLAMAWHVMAQHHLSVVWQPCQLELADSYLQRLLHRLQQNVIWSVLCCLSPQQGISTPCQRTDGWCSAAVLIQCCSHP